MIPRLSATLESHRKSKGRDGSAAARETPATRSDAVGPENRVLKAMPDERKSILLRIPPALWEEINRAAQRDLRSTNAQIEFLLRHALKSVGGEKEPDSVKPAGNKPGRRV